MYLKLDLKFIKLLFLTMMAVVVFSCVPKATEKKALCGTNQAFNSITRACYSVAVARTVPVATLNTASAIQETPTEVVLTYTDTNSDVATACSISGVNSNIEMISPVLVKNVSGSTSVYSKMYDLNDTLTNLNLALTNYDATYSSAASVAAVAAAVPIMSNLATYYSVVYNSIYLPTVQTNIANYLTNATSLITLTAPFKTDTGINYFYTLAQTRLTDLQNYYNSIANKCICTGTKCSTYIVPKKDFIGTAGFSYSVTDIDGSSSSKSVTVNVTNYSKATSYYLPTVESVYVSGNESTSSIPLAYTFTLGTARDVFSTTSFTYNYTKTRKTLSSVKYYVDSSNVTRSLAVGTTYVESDNNLGIITGCLGLGGSATTAKTCLYIPNSGDTFDSLTAPQIAAKATYTNTDSLTFTSLLAGDAGNSVKVYYVDITSTSLPTLDATLGIKEDGAQKFGMASGAEELFLRVKGDSIYIYFRSGMPTTAQIQNLINNDTYAKSLVVVSGGSSATNATINATMLSGITLTGATAPYDGFSYTASNAYGTSLNTAKAMIHIASAVDIPVLTTGMTNQVSYYENSASRTPNTTSINVTFAINTDFTAPDNVTSCTATDTSVGSYLSGSSSTLPPVCSCVANICTATVYPAPNASSASPFPFQYTICSTGGCSSTGTYYVYLLPVNDQPTATGISAAATINENSSSSASSYSFDVTTDPGNAFESSQTVSLTAASSNTTIVPNANIVITTDSSNANLKHVTITPALNQSSSSPLTITFTAKDTGGTSNCTSTFSAGEACDTKLYTLALTVTPTNDPPSITSTATFPVETNEGGYVIVGPFTIDEDVANSSDENADPIYVSVASDNQSVLMTSGITMFYDLNDNGVEESATESRASGAMLETVRTNDSSAHKLYLKLKPVGGSSGSANVTITATDSTFVAASAQSSTFTFSLNVNPVAAVHGGWSNISAVGIKTDKFGAPASYKDIVCNYNKVASDTNVCTGSSGAGDCGSTSTSSPTSSPTGVYTTTASNVIFWDNTHNNCYYSYKNPISGATPTYLWKSFNTTCPVTRSSAICSTPNATVTTSPIGVTIPASVGLLYYNSTNSTYYVSTGTTTTSDWSTANICNSSSNAILTSTINTIPNPIAENQYYYNTITRKCIKSQLNASTYSWNTTQPYNASKVTLSWNAFSLTGSGTDLYNSIIGYNVYRREARKDYDYKTGQLINTTYGNAKISLLLSTTSTLTFVDTTAEAGKVYYYTVRPVDGNHNTASSYKYSTYTPEVYSEVRVVAPPVNYAFVHRWMINQEVCGKMHMTLSNGKVDASKSFRCAYNGPGAKLSSGSYYYDYGKDLLVDINEMGCPYTLNTGGGHCSNGTNGCVGIGDPTVAAISGQVDGDIYYDRSAGTCYMYKNASSTWYEFNDTTNIDAAQFILPITAAATYDPYNTALNAPMVNVQSYNADTICGRRSAPTVYNYSTTAMALGTMKLPEKKDYIAYSAAPTTYSDTTIADTEQGDSLNLQSRCNSSSASGLSSYFTDSDAPTSSTLYTLPGTYSSGIRSIVTGSVPWGLSYGTESCVSRYGIQDLFGNVAEWTKDRMSCTNNTTKLCTADPSVTGASVTNSLSYDFNGNSEYYGFNLITGPANDTNGTGMAGDKTPALDSFLTSWLFDEESYSATLYNFPLGLPINTNFSAMISCPYTKGGTCKNTYTSPLDGSTIDLGCQGSTDPTTAGMSFATSGEYYLDHSSGKCWRSSGTAWGDYTSSLSTPAISGVPYMLDIGSSNGMTYAQMHGDAMIVNGSSIYSDADTVKAKTGAFAVGGSYLSTSKAGRYTSELIPLSNKRVDVGFRCIAPIQYTDYDTSDTFHTYNYNY